MIGITLSSEQIRNAPAEVRSWIEREVMTSLSRQAAPENDGKPHGEHLSACSEQDVAAILSQIQGILPAVNVLFEFGRQGLVVGQPDIRAFRLLDIAHHARLQNVGQVIACLDIINKAFSRVCGDPEAVFCGFDREGHCFIALETQQSIVKVWRQVVASQQPVATEQKAAASTADARGTPISARATEPAPAGEPVINGTEAVHGFLE
ncbi:MAG: hypothetical protein V4517_14900 [Pseudomonadota bacterium]